MSSEATEFVTKVVRESLMRYFGKDEKWSVYFDENKFRDIILMMWDGKVDIIGLINSALTLMEWSFREVRDGKLVASLDEHTTKYEECPLTFLTDLKPKPRFPRPLFGVGYE